MSEQYNTNAVPYGSLGVIAFLTSIGGAIGSYLIEGFTANRTSNRINRPDQIGSPNGWALTAAQETGSCIVQIPKDPAVGGNLPLLTPGTYFVATTDVTLGAERWVIESTSDAREMLGYFKLSCNIVKDRINSVPAS